MVCQCVIQDKKVMEFNFTVAYVIKASLTHGGAENGINTWALSFCIAK